MTQTPQRTRSWAWLGVLAFYLGACGLAVALAGFQPRTAGAIEEHAVQIAQAAEPPWDAVLPDPPTSATR